MVNCWLALSGESVIIPVVGTTYQHNKGIVMLPTIALDLDGTLSDFYHVPGWLESLHAQDATPYYKARPLHDMDYLNTLIELYKDAGGHVCVVSWCAKGKVSQGFTRATQAAKMLWLRDNLPAIDDVRVVDYGTPKYLVVKNASNTVLFDDEKPNRDAFRRAGGQARLPKSLCRFMVAQIRKTC